MGAHRRTDGHHPRTRARTGTGTRDRRCRCARRRQGHDGSDPDRYCKAAAGGIRASGDDGRPVLSLRKGAGRRRRAGSGQPRTARRHRHVAPWRDPRDRRRHPGPSAAPRGDDRRPRRRLRPAGADPRRALVIKARAASSSPNPKHRRDLARLLVLVADIEQTRSELSAKERAYLRAHDAMLDPRHEAWRGLAAAEDGVIALDRLSARG